MNLHQIWLGSEMPQRIRNATDRIRVAATAGGWHYHLWTESDLRSAFGNDSAALLLDTTRAVLPPSTWASLFSDWARWCILAAEGGLYLDTDNELTLDAFPAPAAFGGADITQHTRRDTRMETGAIAANGEAGRAAAAEVLRRLTARLFNMGELAEVVQRKRLTSIIAPQWVLDECHPALRALGYSVAPMKPEIASCTRQNAALYHWGSWTWNKDTRAPEPLPDTRKPWQQPRAAALLPPARKTAAATEAGTARQMFTLPQGCRRVVVLSNVQRGFTLPSLEEGDLVVSLNRCVHAAAVRAAAPKATHWAVVRSGSGGRWFNPPDFTGFSRVVFVDHSLGLGAFSWHRQFKTANPTASPTTGFLVANTMRELHPSTPLLLVGFDPGVDHGTHLWSGHAWQYERDWYTKHGFFILKPHYEQP